MRTQRCALPSEAVTVEGMSRLRVCAKAVLATALLFFSGSLGGEVLAPAHAAPSAPERMFPLPVPVVPVDAPARRVPPDRLFPPVKPTIPADALCPQWWGTARSLGWDEDALLRLDVVMFRESRCLPDVWNKEDPNGGSRGLLQVNGSWTRWLREQGILEAKEDLFDPETNLAAALAIYRYGMDRYDFGWGPWGYRYKDPYRG